MRWRKRGLVYSPRGDVAWMRSHAANPVAQHLAGDRFRVYFSPRDAENRSQVASLLMDVADGSARVVEGSVVDALVDESHAAALVVVGRRGRHTLPAALGSVSRGVAERAVCPVVVVHPHDKT